MKKAIYLSIILLAMILAGSVSAQGFQPGPPPDDDSWEEGPPPGHHPGPPPHEHFKMMMEGFKAEHPEAAKALMKYIKEHPEFAPPRGGPRGDFPPGMHKGKKMKGKHNRGGPWNKPEKMEQMKEKDPERHKRFMEIKELDDQEREIGEKYKAASSKKEKDKLAKELMALLGKDFQLRQEEIKGRMKDVENKLKEIKAKFETRQQKKDEIIKKRFDRLTSEKDFLDW